MKLLMKCWREKAKEHDDTPPDLTPGAVRGHRRPGRLGRGEAVVRAGTRRGAAARSEGAGRLRLPAGVPGRYALRQALAQYERAIELDPDDDKLHYHFGCRWSAGARSGPGPGIRTGALADWRRALEVDPDNIGPVYSSALLLEHEGRLQEAAVGLAVHRVVPGARRRAYGGLERVNREIGRRYLSESSLALVMASDHPDRYATNGTQAVAELTAS